MKRQAGADAQGTLLDCAAETIAGDRFFMCTEKIVLVTELYWHNVARRRRHI